MSKKRDIISAALSSDGVSSVIQKYRGRELEFFLARGRLYPEKLEEIFNAIFKGECEDLVVIGPRGGGKTMGVYDAATALFIFREFDVFAVGGSEKQAMNGFRYMTQILYFDRNLSEDLQEGLKAKATGPRGNWFEIAAASQKGVRGPHPGDMHPEMGWVPHGGLLIKDERDEMADDIADAADFTMDTADPSLIVTTSTMHRDDGGGIAQMADEAEARGARVIKFDALDVCEVCLHDCAACPGGYAFAGALFGGVMLGGPNDKLPNGAPALPAATAKSREAWAKFRQGNSWAKDETAYCEGRAKMHRPGHLKMRKIFRAFRRSRNREAFEVELMCRKRKGAKYIVDGPSWDRCLTPDLAYIPGYEPPVGTIDWGLKGMAVATALQGQMDSTIAIVDARCEHMASADEILEIFRRWRSDYGLTQIYADASHPYENLKLAEDDFDVTEVSFAKWKEFGAGWIKGLVERGKLRLRGELRRPSVAGEKPEYIFFDEASETGFWQIKKWQRDKNGKIVKKNDHFPDAVSCAAQHFAESHDWEPDFLGTGVRDAFGVGGI